MRIEDYPPQEPLSENGVRYNAEMRRRSEGIEGLEFEYGGDVHQRLMLFPARKPNGTVLAFMIGGGWTNGYKELLAYMAPPLNAAGITFASLGYRMAPKHLFPAGWHDAADAVAWLHSNVARHGGDPARLFVGGWSAGGHYAALLACRRDWQASRGLPRDVIRGCLCISGIFDFTPGNGMSVRPRFLGPEADGNDVHASPLFHLGTLPPPMLLAHGDNDFPHLAIQARKFERVVSVLGGDIERVELPDRTHFSAAWAAVDDGSRWLATAADWLARH
ncbi:MAG: alpha/beta hydrolase [Lautropia sp.]